MRVHSGPRTRSSPSILQRPRRIGTELVSRRSKPIRVPLRANGEQPYPWDTSAPGCDEPTSRCQTPPSYDLGRYQPVIPGVPLSVEHDGPSIQNHRITMTCFRTCSRRRSQSSPSMPICTNLLMSDPGLANLRAPPLRFGEETAPVKLPTRHCPQPRSGANVRTSNIKGGIYQGWLHADWRPL